MSETVAAATLNAPGPAPRRLAREQPVADFGAAVARLLAEDGGDEPTDRGPAPLRSDGSAPRDGLPAVRDDDPEPTPDPAPGHSVPEPSLPQALLAAILPGPPETRDGQPATVHLAGALALPAELRAAPKFGARPDMAPDKPEAPALARGPSEGAIAGLEPALPPDLPLLGRMRLAAAPLSGGPGAPPPRWSAFRATVTSIATHFAPASTPAPAASTLPADAAVPAGKPMSAPPGLGAISAVPAVPAVSTAPLSLEAAGPTAALAASEDAAPGVTARAAPSPLPRAVAARPALELRSEAPAATERKDAGRSPRIGAAVPPVDPPTAPAPPDTGRLGTDQLQRIAVLVAGAAGEAAPPEPTGGPTALRPPEAGPLRVVSLTLNPEHLGRVTITIRLTGDRLSLRVEAERDETARMIEADGDALAGLLDREGYGVEAIVTATLRDPLPPLAPTAPAAPGAPGGSSAGLNHGADSERQPTQQPRDENRDARSGPFRDNETNPHEEAAAPGRPGRLYV
jgi:hypothetical protein